MVERQFDWIWQNISLKNEMMHACVSAVHCVRIHKVNKHFIPKNRQRNWPHVWNLYRTMFVCTTCIPFITNEQISIDAFVIDTPMFHWIHLFAVNIVIYSSGVVWIYVLSNNKKLIGFTLQMQIRNVYFHQSILSHQNEILSLILIVIIVFVNFFFFKEKKMFFLSK